MLRNYILFYIAYYITFLAVVPVYLSLKSWTKVNIFYTFTGTGARSSLIYKNIINFYKSEVRSSLGGLPLAVKIIIIMESPTWILWSWTKMKWALLRNMYYKSEYIDSLCKARTLSKRVPYCEAILCEAKQYQKSDIFEYFVVLSYIFCCSNNLLSLRQSVTIRYVPLYLLFLVWEISTYNPLFIPEHVRWPSRLGIGAFLFVSTVWFKMVYSGISITASTLLLVAVSGWFTDLTLESTEGRVTIRVQNDIITGFKIFLISECMMFFCCFWGFIHMGLLPNIFILNNLPPNGILPIWP